MTGVVDAVERGWHAVAFDGPGQGRARVEDGLGPVDDWGKVVAAVLDAVCARPELAGATVALLGVADGGNLVVRAAAAEPRVAAVVCDPGVVRPVDGALAQLPDAVVDEVADRRRRGLRARARDGSGGGPGPGLHRRQAHRAVAGSDGPRRAHAPRDVGGDVGRRRARRAGAGRRPRRRRRVSRSVGRAGRAARPPRDARRVHDRGRRGSRLRDRGTVAPGATIRRLARWCHRRRETTRRPTEKAG